MTAAEIRELSSRRDHTVGSHTVNHLALTTQTLATKRCEVITDKSALEHAVGKPVRLFSYPYGDFDDELVTVVGDAGFLAAVTVEPGLVTAGGSLLTLPRYEVTTGDHARFADRMREIFQHPRT